MFSGIFIDRPRFAIVIAVVILAGLIAIRSIPIAQFSLPTNGDTLRPERPLKTISSPPSNS
jgi:hypothetical protein